MCRERSCRKSVRPARCQIHQPMEDVDVRRGIIPLAPYVTPKRVLLVARKVMRSETNPRDEPRDEPESGDTKICMNAWTPSTRAPRWPWMHTNNTNGATATFPPETCEGPPSTLTSSYRAFPIFLSDVPRFVALKFMEI